MIEKSLVINIGAQKSGTSWLFKCMQEHKQICTSHGKETHYFSSYYSNKREYLNKYFKNCQNKEVLYESSTSYLYSQEAGKRIKNDFPNAKIIILLRDPVARAVSHYNHVKNKKDPYKKYSLSRLLEKFPEILRNSEYEISVKFYTETFGERNVLILKYEDIAINPQKIINKTCDFIGIPKFTPKSLHSKYNSGRARSNKFYKLATRWYLKLSKIKFFIFFFKVLKKLRIDSILLEKILIKTSGNTQLQINTSVLEKALIMETAFYKKTFEG